MKLPLKVYREQLLKVFLDFLWDAWTALGVPGHGAEHVVYTVDPEALLAFTCSMGRFDPRLFDEVIEWLLVNGRFLNVQRMKSILRKESFSGSTVLAAMAAWLAEQDSSAKWSYLARQSSPPPSPEPLFHLADGRPVPTRPPYDAHFLAWGWKRVPIQNRGHGRLFPSTAPAALVLKMRALFGVNSRSDALAYLLLNGRGHPRAMARELYYSQKAIHDIMADLDCSGIVTSSRTARERVFRLSAEGRSFLMHGSSPMPWINWPVLLGTAEHVWNLTNTLDAQDGPPLFQASEIQLRMPPLLQRLYRQPWTSSPPTVLESDDSVAALKTFLSLFSAITRPPRTG